MSNKINTMFFSAYIELDNICAASLEVKKGGVSAYINKLVESRYAPGRSEVLPKLVEYRKLRNRMAHEEGALSEIKNVTKLDVQWITRFAKQVEKKRDPISMYERKAYRFANNRALRIFVTSLAVIGISVLIFIVLKTLGVF